MVGEGQVIDNLMRGDMKVAGRVVGDTLIERATIRKHIVENFNCNPMCQGKIGALPTGTGGDENIMRTHDAEWEYHILGTQTIVAPKIGANGGIDLNGMDQADDDGAEYNLGITSRSPGVFTVGTDDAFFARLKFSVADVSGSDDLAIGFRKVEANQANIDDYDEMAALNVISGAITMETILNGGATSATDTTDAWADLATHELEVRVSGAGVVTFRIDGAEPTVVATFTFDDGEVVMPFIYVLNASDVAGAVEGLSFECGLQADRV